MNGIAAYGANLIPVAGTFLNFVSYAAPALRLSALSRHRVVWIATHDSVRCFPAVPLLADTDGDPVDRLGLAATVPRTSRSKRWRTSAPCPTRRFGGLPTGKLILPATPWLRICAVLRRPGVVHRNETSAAYCAALRSKETPSVLALCRQDLPQLAGSSIEKALRGGYVLLEDEAATITLVATGSEASSLFARAPKRPGPPRPPFQANTPRIGIALPECLGAPGRETWHQGQSCGMFSPDPPSRPPSACGGVANGCNCRVYHAWRSLTNSPRITSSRF